MVNITTIFSLVYHRVRDYNLLTLDEDDKFQNPSNTLGYQKYTTRLCSISLLMCLYVLFYATLMKPQAHKVIISNIDLEKFEELYSKHGERISCSCSTKTISYKTFVSNTIRIHPICSSFFTTQQWIKALYLFNRSSYRMKDFRTTASSQFQLLSSLCSFSQNIVFEKEIQLNNNELITVNLRPESQIHSEVNAIVESFKSSLSIDIVLFLNYFRIVSQANNFITGVNTNGLVWASKIDDPLRIFVAVSCGYSDIETSTQTKNSIPCGITQSTVPTAFYLNSYGWSVLSQNSTFVKGFYTGCNPLNALLQSTLDCLYEIRCLQLWNDYFPSLNQMNLNLTDYVLSTNKTNLTVHDHLSNLFVDQWTTKINYSAYFSNCNSSKCTYTTTNIINYSYAIVLFISLYGGLIIIFRIISSLSIKFISILKHKPRNTISIEEFLISSKVYLQNFNLFNTEDNIKQEKLLTRIYLGLLLISLTTLIVCNSLNIETFRITTSNPSLNTYIFYSQTLTCSCSTKTIPYYRFISFSPILHPICSSEWISDKWLTILSKSTTSYIKIDWRNRALQQFSLLSNICNMANETITNAIKNFFLQSYLVSNMPTIIDFHVQMDQILAEFYQSTTVYFHQLIDAIDLYIQVDRPYMIRFVQSYSFKNSFSVEIIENNTINSQQLTKVTLSSTQIQDIYSNLTECICSPISNCQISSAIFNHVDLISTADYPRNNTVSYVVPGFFIGCSEMNSILFSTLECLYSDSVCFQILMDIIKEIYLWNVEDPSWFDIKPLIYNSTTTNFNKNSSISTILQKLMLEQWNPSYSYENFYDVCSPNYCFYEERIYSISILIIFLLSMMGGLIISLRLILIGLNCFHRLRRRKLTTYLFYLLFICSFVLLAIFTIGKQQILTRNFNKPSFDTYKQIRQEYGDKLTCSCSSITSTFDQFVNIKPIFHPICSSEFISNEIINNFSIGILSNMSKYEIRDYRRLILSHIQYLKELCRISNQSIHNSVKHFVSTSLVTKELLLEDDFNRQINSSIEKNIRHSFYSIFFLIRHINFGNAIISTYGTNFRYVIPEFYSHEYLNAEPEIYDHNCSCALHLNCTSQAYFVEENSSDKIPLKGLKIGCTPSESLFSSTLECFSDQLCINIIREYMNYSYTLDPLPITTVNLTVDELVKNLFINEWSTTKNYSAYFQQCLPLSCSYTYEQDSNLIYIILYILSLQGGMIIAFKWISSRLIQFMIKINHIESLMTKFISTCIIFMISIVVLRLFSVYIVRKDIYNNTVESIEITTSSSSSYLSIAKGYDVISVCKPQFKRKPIFTREDTSYLWSVFIDDFNNDNRLDIGFRMTPYYASSSDPSSYTRIHVLLGNGNGTFGLSIISSMGYAYQLDVVHFADFNGDNILDYASLNPDRDFIYIFFGNGDGTFAQMPNKCLGYLNPISRIFTADLNNDGYLDIVIMPYNFYGFTILVNNGNGTYTKEHKHLNRKDYYPDKIFFADFNNDAVIDIAVISDISRGINVYLGYGNGSFHAGKWSFTGGSLVPTNMVVGDFNEDKIPDIIVIYREAIVVGVLFGYGNGTFGGRTRLVLTNATTCSQCTTAVGDFNRDGHLDIVLLTYSRTTITICYGYGNGLFEIDVVIMLTDHQIWNTGIYVADLNADGYSDIVIYSPEGINVFMTTGQCDNTTKIV